MKFKALTAIAALLAAPAFAGGADDDVLTIDGQEMMSKVAAAPALAETGIDTAISGWHFREDDTQAMQMDTFDNPAMIAVDQALDAWNAVEGTADKSCASCHGAPEESMAGVRAVYPKWNEAAGEMRTLAMQINTCRTENLGAEAYKYDGAEMTAMEALITVQSRGMPMNVATDGPAAEFFDKGKEIYYTRYGILELSCANCHEQNYGNYIRADHLSQGQINGFPTYRLKNAGLVQVHNRFRGCIRDTRGETFAVGSPEFVALEVYVSARGNGLSIEGPSVRQ
ncbi:sulfur oxidation c-type cytochrome SoxA [Thetidibacter halocola]|uniref:SoxAX cytochrome complex subunit A n=1 Tax=Thetidibacter halocola TaxID=2827239 RepID=A0A8J8B7P6_9RHOB|nr:sulfur oxidation c-type cytochrome SoxA [Thetidibacter halocola]MBS0125341.1 sulfur oxidation c-type cytochrome SoxA [Thetidibacter halocola]